MTYKKWRRRKRRIKRERKEVGQFFASFRKWLETPTGDSKMVEYVQAMLKGPNDVLEPKP